MRIPILLGLSSAMLLILSTVELVAMHALDLGRPGQLLSLVLSPAHFYSSVGSTIILGLAFGMIAAVVLNRHLTDKSTARAESAPRKPFR